MNSALEVHGTGVKHRVWRCQSAGLRHEIFAYELAGIVLGVDVLDSDQLTRVELWIIVKHKVEGNREFCFFDCHSDSVLKLNIRFTLTI